MSTSQNTAVASKRDDGPEPVSLDALLRAREQLWMQLDAAASLSSSIEATATPVTGAVAATVASHDRLTNGPDLVAELRTIEIEVKAGLDRIASMGTSIEQNTAEIARLKRNEMIRIACMVGAVVVVILLIVAAAG
jgi:hypothetical protein